MRYVSLTATQAAWIAKKVRKALRAGLVTPHQFVVLDALLWEARERGSDTVTAAYSWLEKLANVSHQVAVDAIKAAVALNLLRKIKHTTLEVWTNGGRKWRQRPNEYVFCCESTAPTESKKEVIQIRIMEPNTREQREAQAALAARREVLEARARASRRQAPVPG